MARWHLPLASLRPQAIASGVAWASIAVNVALGLLNLAIAAISGSLAVAAEMVRSSVGALALVAVRAGARIPERGSGAR